MTDRAPLPIVTGRTNVHTSTLRAIAGTAVLAFVLAACGQKPGVHVEGGAVAADGSGQSAAVAAPQGGTTAPAAGGDVTGGAGTTAGDDGFATAEGGADTGGSAAPAGQGGGSTTTGGQAGTSAGGGSGGGGSATTQGSGGSGGGEEAAPAGNRQPQGSDRTGAGPDKLVFASHAPVTGAAPLPTTSFEKSGDLYWRHVIDREGGTVLGRKKVELLFRDDKYDPNSARQVCRELEAKAFVVSGGGGTDQIQACGQFAGVAKFPYFSAGVTEAGLRGNPWYFAASMSYKQQGRLLAQMVTKRPETKGKKVAAIITDTPNFDDARDGWEAGVNEFGIDYYKTLRHPKGDTAWYNAFVGDLNNAGVEVVYLLTSPVDYIRFAQKAQEQGFNPQYIGVGISMGLNAVLGSGCDWVDGGLFFSPFPGLDWARQNVPEFFEAAQDFGVPDDDIALALWGTNAVMHELLKRYRAVFGDDLTREDFRAVVEQSTGVQSKIFPPLNYSPQDHFGSKQVHLLKADCATGEYKTEATFAGSF